MSSDPPRTQSHSQSGAGEHARPSAPPGGTASGRPPRHLRDVGARALRGLRRPAGRRSALLPLLRDPPLGHTAAVPRRAPHRGRRCGGRRSRITARLVAAHGVGSGGWPGKRERRRLGRAGARGGWTPARVHAAIRAARYSAGGAADRAAPRSLGRWWDRTSVASVPAKQVVEIKGLPATSAVPAVAVTGAPAATSGTSSTPPSSSGGGATPRRPRPMPPAPR